MTAAELIKLLQSLDSETVIVTFPKGKIEGFKHPISLIAMSRGDCMVEMIQNRAKFVKGQERSDFLSTEHRPRTKAKRIKGFVIA